MKKNDNKIQIIHEKEDNNITRKEALKKAGKYAALTAASMLIILSPKEAAAQSYIPDPGWGN